MLKTVQVRFKVAQGCWMSFDDNVCDFPLMPRRSNCAVCSIISVDTSSYWPTIVY